MGFASAFTTVCSLLRFKISAILLGPMGTGLGGQLSQASGLVSEFTGLGIYGASIREVGTASTIQGNTPEGLTERLVAIRAIALGSAGLGFITAIIASRDLAAWALGDSALWRDIAILALAVAAGRLASVNQGIIEGLRAIKVQASLAAALGLANLLSAAVLFYFLGLRGVPWQLVLQSVFALIGSTIALRACGLDIPSWYCRPNKAAVQRTLGLGIAFAGIRSMRAGAEFVQRSILVASLGLAGVGVLGVATSAFGLLFGQAWAAFAPEAYASLSQSAHSPSRMRDTLTAQSEFLLHLMTPLVPLLAASSQLLVRVLSNSEYDAAVPALAWLSFGLAAKGLVMVNHQALAAISAKKLLVKSEFASLLGRLICVTLGLKFGGMVGAAQGIAIAEFMALAISFIAAHSSGVTPHTRDLLRRTWPCAAILMATLSLLIWVNGGRLGSATLLPLALIAALHSIFRIRNGLRESE